MHRFLELLGFLLAVFTCCCQATHTNAQESLMHAMFDECCADLDIPLSRHYFERGYLGGLKRDDDKSLELVFCVMIRLEFANCQGSIGRQPLIDFFTDGHDVSSLPGVIDECDRVKQGKTVLERCYSFYRCFFDQKKFVV